MPVADQGPGTPKGFLQRFDPKVGGSLVKTEKRNLDLQSVYATKGSLINIIYAHIHTRAIIHMYILNIYIVQYNIAFINRSSYIKNIKFI